MCSACPAGVVVRLQRVQREITRRIAARTPTFHSPARSNILDGCRRRAAASRPGSAVVSFHPHPQLRTRSDDCNGQLMDKFFCRLHLQLCGHTHAPIPAHKLLERAPEWSEGDQPNAGADHRPHVRSRRGRDTSFFRKGRRLPPNWSGYGLRSSSFLNCS